jgi:hypothetical protein
MMRSAAPTVILESSRAPCDRRVTAPDWTSTCAGSIVGATTTVALILVAVLASLPVLGVLALFFWAAAKDGEEDRAVQARLGIRRKTRMGR